MTARVSVTSELLQWACERAGYEPDELAEDFPNFAAWLDGARQPTFKQLEKFARKTRTPFGYFFLPSPPDEPLPLPDLRTVRDRPERPSPELLDTLYTMQRRQDWLRQELLAFEADPLDFVGSARLSDDPVGVGKEMRRYLGLVDGWAASVRTWNQATGELRKRIEELGVIAVINGAVGNNTHRPLDVEEFRGFALPDRFAPLIFVNGADAKSAQMFTLAHELAHIWLGTEGAGLSGFHDLRPGGSNVVERFCDQAAAELLVPAEELRERWTEVKRRDDRFQRMARSFKVSPIVAARRALDLHLIGREEFFEFYSEYTAKERSSKRSGRSGGDFYRTQNSRIGETFARFVYNAALEGRLSFKQAYDLTGLKGGAFQEYGRRLGMSLP